MLFFNVEIEGSHCWYYTVIKMICFSKMWNLMDLHLYLLDTKITKIAVLINVMQSVHLRAWRVYGNYTISLSKIQFCFFFSRVNIVMLERKVLLWFKVELFLFLQDVKGSCPEVTTKMYFEIPMFFYSLPCRAILSSDVY